MPDYISANGQTIAQVFANGVDCEKVYANGHLIWEKAKTFTITQGTSANFRGYSAGGYGSIDSNLLLSGYTIERITAKPDVFPAPTNSQFQLVLVGDTTGVTPFVSVTPDGYTERTHASAGKLFFSGLTFYTWTGLPTAGLTNWDGVGTVQAKIK